MQVGNGRLPPERIVETPEDVARSAVPAPPQIVGQLVQAMDAVGQFSHALVVLLDGMLQAVNRPNLA